ncbi:MAG: hypothetical protein AVDCRST_MAG93-1098 [uncultured Chloroflexia bacterium]|uniref:Uncharacterized protein n=1 Tax=uncultured Chloroflexia bacterium TaxID=1672391 RepID=A0A6J4HXU6_9CHLR|nr:MAG: hypothetical protein AVDCRST_MAG93-1098 [uncultured Chloroflexia bacterium]
MRPLETSEPGGPFFFLVPALLLHTEIRVDHSNTPCAWLESAYDPLLTVEPFRCSTSLV